MLNSKIKTSILLLFLCHSVLAAHSPEGKWAARSPMLGDAPTGIVKISIVQGRLFGELIEVLPFNGKIEHFCKRKNRPLQAGPVVMCNYHQSGSKWVGGHIYDATSGKIYDSELWLSADGNELTVTGESIVFSKAITWRRVH